MRSDYSPRTILALMMTLTCAAGCGSTKSRACVPGAAAACTCSDGRTGSQLCNVEASALGVCMCSGIIAGSAGSDGGAEVGATGAAGTAGVAGTAGSAGAGAGGSSGTSGTGGAGGNVVDASAGTDGAAGGTEGGIDVAAGDAPSAPMTGPSCNGDTGAGTNCSGGDCCKSFLIPGGTFKRGYDGVYNVDDTNPATVSSFYLDKLEVTVGRFRVFLGAGWSTQSNPPPEGAGANPHVSGSGWKAAWKLNLAASLNEATSNARCDSRSPFTAGQIYETWPMACANWYEAFAFCAWDGGRLPTEAEWNYAAAGGNEQRIYPWSNPPTVSVITDAHAVYHSNTMVAGGGPPFGVVGEKPLGAGKWGQLDLAGNLDEWLLDYSNDGYPKPCVDCADLTTSDRRHTAGGSWSSDATGVVVGTRATDSPAARSLSNGFRCARDK